MANTHGELVDIMSWLHTDRERDIIYMNLNSEHNKIVMLAPGQEPKMIENGTNEHSVLLASSFQIQPFAYKPNTGEAGGFTRLKTLLMDTAPAELPQRYFLTCWMISTFLMNYSTDRGLLQALGSTKVGKSKVPERMTTLIYGESFVGKGTGAAETRLATNNPLIVLDNLENRNLLQGTVDFLLFMANSAHKPKAKAGSDTEVLFQKLNAMCMITSIEAFPGKLPELVNRTWPLMLEKEFKQPGYMHDETMRQIKKHRNEILSDIFRMISLKVLPRLERRKFWSEYLQTKHAGHNKDRNNEHLCTIILILEALLEHIPLAHCPDPIEKQAITLVDKWIAYHEEQAKDTEVTSNSLLGVMDGLADEILTMIRKQSGRLYKNHEDGSGPVFVYEDPEYRQMFLLTEPTSEVLDGDPKDPFAETISCQRLEMVLHSGKLDEIIQRFCSNIGKKNPFENATALAYRIRNDRSVIESAGWSIIPGKNGQSHYKKVGNQRYWKFSKLIKELPL
jgi:DNA primase